MVTTEMHQRQMFDYSVKSAGYRILSYRKNHARVTSQQVSKSAKKIGPAIGTAHRKKKSADLCNFFLNILTYMGNSVVSTSQQASKQLKTL
jgi:hypothetical protein